MEFVKKIVEMRCEFRAIVTTPSGFDKEKESLPIIFFLHGAGERGEDIEKVKIHGIPKYFSADSDYLGLRVITVSPQCPSDMVWPNLAHQLKEFIITMTKEYNADPDKVSITGISMGGFGTWELINTCPELFSCAAPICGGGMNWRIKENLPFPIYAFHGKDDPTVPYMLSCDMVDAVNSRGGKATLTTYDGCGHNSWAPAYEETDIIKILANAVRK